MGTIRIAQKMSLLVLCLGIAAPLWAKSTPTVRILITSSPAKAQVYIDGKLQGYSVDPAISAAATKIRIAQGSHSFRLVLSGYKPLEKQETVVTAETFHYTLEALPGLLRFDTPLGSEGTVNDTQVRIDGVVVGKIPLQPNPMEVAPGTKHKIEFYKPGFRTVAPVMVEAKPGEVASVDVPVLEPEAKPVVPEPERPVLAHLPFFIPPDNESAQGAEVSLQNVRGVINCTLPQCAQTTAQPGKYYLSVKKVGYQPFINAQFELLADKDAQLVPITLQPLKKEGSAEPSPVVGSAPKMGTLVITVRAKGGASPKNAVILVDGAPFEKQPITLAVGKHSISVDAEGYGSEIRETTIRAEEQSIETFELIPQEKPTKGQLRLIGVGSFEEATISINGRLMQPTTALFQGNGADVEAGPVYIEVKKPKWGTWRQQVQLTPGQKTTLTIPSGRITLTSLPPQANVFVDGISVGTTPQEWDLAIGRHEIGVNQTGFEPFQKTVDLKEGATEVIAATLVEQKLPDAPLTSEQIQQSLLETSSFGGTTLRKGFMAVDLGAGYPYYGRVRLHIGALRKAVKGTTLGLDFVVGVRTTAYETDAEMGARFQYLHVLGGVLSAAVDTSLFAGGGPDFRQGVEWQLGLPVSLNIGRKVLVTFRPHVQVISEQNCPSESTIQDLVKTSDFETIRSIGDPARGGGCVAVNSSGASAIYAAAGYNAMSRTANLNNASYRLGDGSVDPAFAVNGTGVLERYNTVRWMLQGVIEANLFPSFSIWGMAEGAPNQKERPSFTNRFNPALASRDLLFSAQLGVTFKFSSF